MKYNGLRERMNEAEMILVGLGEEFDDVRLCRQSAGYESGRTMLEETERSYLIPAYQDYYRKKLKSRAKEALERLEGMIRDKNYFVVAASCSDDMAAVSWAEGRFVSPCGGIRQKQCVHGCDQGLEKLTEKEKQNLGEQIELFCTMSEDGKTPDLKGLDSLLGNCPKCGNPLVLNNIYTEFYDENGYLEIWQKYRSWLQGTLNKRLLILELGVGMQCPSVIRWPFEKMTMYNQKAFFYRVHETLYQMPEGLQKNGISISENSIDWLRNLC